MSYTSGVTVSKPDCRSRDQKFCFSLDLKTDTHSNSQKDEAGLKIKLKARKTTAISTADVAAAVTQSSFATAETYSVNLYRFSSTQKPKNHLKTLKI